MKRTVKIFFKISRFCMYACILLGFLFLMFGFASIHLESGPIAIADTIGTTDATMHYSPYRGSYSFQTPSGRYYVFWLESNTAVTTLKYSTSKNFTSWITFDTEPEIGVIGSTYQTFQQIKGQHYAVTCFSSQYMQCVYYQEDEGVFVRTGLINDVTGEIQWLSELCIFNQTVDGTYRAYLDIAYDCRYKPWISMGAWNNTWTNRIYVFNETLIGSGTPYYYYEWNPYGTVRTFFKLCPYRPLNAEDDVSFMWAFASQTFQTNNRIKGKPFSMTGWQYPSYGDERDITDNYVTTWKDTNNFVFPFWSVVSEIEYIGENRSDQQYVHLIYKNSTNSELPYGDIWYKYFDSVGSEWSSETLIYEESHDPSEGYWNYIRHPTLTLIRPTSRGLSLLVSGSRPNSSFNADIRYLEYYNYTWSNITTLCSQGNDFGNVYHSEMLTEEVSGNFTVGKNQTIAIYWNDDNSGAGPPENHIHGVLAETDQTFGYVPPPPPVIPPAEVDVYTFPFIGVLGLLMMVWAPTWVALKFRKRGYRYMEEVLETGAYAILVFFVGFGLYLAWIYG